MKRSTVHVFSSGEFAFADSVRRYLEAEGVKATVVTKHAVQVDPGQDAKAAELIRAGYKWGWDRGKAKAGAA